ncbi:myosin-12-like, partial [Morus notabilis]|uniref:myosin-12-like n=1 Tax=Morus notabilis TaxID=981085 RepID=UPI000CED266C
LELNLSNIESENQVLRQQALVASTNEDLSEELTNLKSKVADLESENELLRSKPVVVVEQKTSSEILQPPPVKVYDNGHLTEEELHKSKIDHFIPGTFMMVQVHDNGHQTEEVLLRPK